MAYNLDEISSIVNQTPFYVTVGMELCGFEEGCSIAGNPRQGKEACACRQAKGEIQKEAGDEGKTENGSEA